MTFDDVMSHRFGTALRVPGNMYPPSSRLGATGRPERPRSAAVDLVSESCLLAPYSPPSFTAGLRRPICATVLLAAAAMLGGLPIAATRTCERWCDSPCSMLNGVVEAECGGCPDDPHYLCRRGAEATPRARGARGSASTNSPR